MTTNVRSLLRLFWSSTRLYEDKADGEWREPKGDQHEWLDPTSGERRRAPLPMLPVEIRVRIAEYVEPFRPQAPVIMARRVSVMFRT